MKKILYITTLSKTIGAFLVPHITALIDEGYEVDCACHIDEDRQLSTELIDKGVKFYDIPFNRNPLSLENIKAFKKLIDIQKKNQYDIIHVHTPIASIYGRLLKVKFPKLKTIYTAHGFHFFDGAPKLNWIIYYPIEKFMARYTDIIITMNEEDFKRAKTFKAKEVYYINGVGIDLKYYNYKLFNKEDERKKLGLKNDDFIILMIAEANKNKNINQVINATELLKRDGIEVKTLIAGDGVMLEELRLEIKKRNLENNIFMLGYRTDIRELISCCDIGVLTSYREGLPRNIMELMSFGKPVIGTNIRGIRDLIKDEENGYLVEVGDYMQTYSAISKLIDDKELLEKMSKESFKRLDKFSLDNIIKDLLEVYKDNEKMLTCDSNE